MKKMAIVGEDTPSFPLHQATNAAIKHSLLCIGKELSREWFSSEDADPHSFTDSFAGLWVAPGSPYINMEKTLELIRFVRENGIPVLGTCGSFFRRSWTPWPG